MLAQVLKRENSSIPYPYPVCIPYGALMTLPPHFLALKAWTIVYSLCVGSARQLNVRAIRSCQASEGADSAQTPYGVCTPHRWCVPCGRFLVHNFSPFDIQHTKSPKNPPRTHALDCMGKVSRLHGLTTSHGSHMAAIYT